MDLERRSADQEERDMQGKVWETDITRGAYRRAVGQKM